MKFNDMIPSIKLGGMLVVLLVAVITLLEWLAVSTATLTLIGKVIFVLAIHIAFLGVGVTEGYKWSSAATRRKNKLLWYTKTRPRDGLFEYHQWRYTWTYAYWVAMISFPVTIYEVFAAETLWLGFWQFPEVILLPMTAGLSSWGVYSLTMNYTMHLTPWANRTDETLDLGDKQYQRTGIKSRLIVAGVGFLGMVWCLI